MFQRVCAALLWVSACLAAPDAYQKVFSINESHINPSAMTVGIANLKNHELQDLFTPLESLSKLSFDGFTTLSHPFFPRHSVRIKKTKFCDTTVNTYTGYVDVEARHLFFYFFESRGDPDNDDVILWTNGGPGCSSSLGLFMELGPCRVINEGGPEFHPDSWNTNANLFFIDQPIGVGFSYADFGETVSTSEEAAVDIAAFVAIFFEHFIQFKGRAFHMSGESYGGRYLPLFASALYDQNMKMIEVGMAPVNLQSVMIGNGMTDYFTMLLSYHDMVCTPASVEPFVDITTCVGIKQTLDRCDRWMQSACVQQFDSINCAAATSFCSQTITQPLWDSGKNPYDISINCEGDISETLCYPQTKHIRQFLDKPSIRHLIGVDSSLTANFSSCNYDVNAAFDQAQDILHPTALYVSALLERGIRILIYVGEYDWICNWVGNERWTLALEWTGQKEFVQAPLRNWDFKGKKAGKTRKAKNFTFATIAAAGHMVPFDKPKESLYMLQRWLAGEDL